MRLHVNYFVFVFLVGSHGAVHNPAKNEKNVHNHVFMGPIGTVHCLKIILLQCIYGSHRHCSLFKNYFVTV